MSFFRMQSLRSCFNFELLDGCICFTQFIVRPVFQAEIPQVWIANCGGQLQYDEIRAALVAEFTRILRANPGGASSLCKAGCLP